MYEQLLWCVKLNLGEDGKIHLIMFSLQTQLEKINDELGPSVFDQTSVLGSKWEEGRKILTLF